VRVCTRQLEAIDWCDLRVYATRDPELASILAHNRDDEKEHASMMREWIRRQDPALDEQLRLYLFTSGPITSVEDSGESIGCVAVVRKSQHWQSSR
jgi:hypothetical protein